MSISYYVVTVSRQVVWVWCVGFRGSVPCCAHHSLRLSVDGNRDTTCTVCQRNERYRVPTEDGGERYC